MNRLLADRLAILVAGEIRALGPVDEVIESFFAGNREVSISLVAGDDPELKLLGCRQAAGSVVQFCACKNATRWIWRMIDCGSVRVTPMASDNYGVG